MDSESRIARLEQSLEELRERFVALEALLTPPALPPIDRPGFVAQPPVVETSQLSPSLLPPVVTDLEPIVSETLTPSPLQTYIAANRVREDAEPVRTQPPKVDHDDLEYKLGINGLLRGGALVVLAAFLFLAAVMISRGYVTPQVQFAGEILLCFGFAAIGFWKRDEREEFGQLMVGLGSAGLYASFAGAHLYKHLFEGEVLVGLYVLLSFLNLGYAHLRASKSFLAIGVLGGFAAAMMPMKESKVILDICLHFLILVPAAVITLKNRWYVVGVAVWVVSSFALVPILGSDAALVVRMGALYVNTAAGLYVCGKLFEPNEFDRHGLLLTAMVCVTGIIGFSVAGHATPPLHVLVFALMSGGVGALLPAEGKSRMGIWLGSLLVAAVLFPMGLKPLQAAFLYSVEGILLGIIAIRRLSNVAFWVGLMVFGLSLAAYAVKLDSQSTLRLWAELLLLASFAVNVFVSAHFALKKFDRDTGDLALFLGSLGLLAVFLRTTVLTVPGTGTGLKWAESAMLGLAAWSIASTVVASRVRRLGLVISAGVAGVIAADFALIREPSTSPQWLTVALLFSTALNATLAITAGAKHLAGSYPKGVRIAYGALISVIFIRLLQVVGHHKVGAFSEETIVYFGFGVLNAVWTVLALRFRRSETLVLAGTAWLCCAAVAVGVQSSPVLSWLRPSLQITSLLSLGILFWITPRKEADEGGITSFASFFGLVLSSLLLTEFLVRPGIGMNRVSAISASWVVYALFLLVVGFRAERRYLRYSGLAVFGLTVGKVVLIDLSELDSMIRVGILLLLGLGMIGTGYWYILWDRKRRSTEQEKPE
ncbi:MAG: DUF2339 domain-containing protein [Armatimonadota bacterium]